MSGRVVAHGGLADLGVDHRVHFVAHADRLLGDDLVRAHTLDWVIAAFHFGYDGVVIVAVKPSAVANLASGFGVKRRVIEDDFAFFARLEFLRALPVVDDGQNFAIFRPRLPISFKLRFRQLLTRRISSLLGRALPGSASTLALFSHCTVESFFHEGNSLVPKNILNKVQWQSESIVELE